jgi:hypothetical protein
LHLCEKEGVGGGKEALLNMLHAPFGDSSVSQTRDCLIDP